MELQINKYAALTAIFFLVMGLSSCVKEEEQPSVETSGEPVPALTAHLFEAGTRLSANAEGVTSWDAEDGLAAFVSPAGTGEASAYRFLIDDVEKEVFTVRDSEGNIPPSTQPVLLPEAEAHDWLVVSPNEAAQKTSSEISVPEFSLDGQTQDLAAPEFSHLTPYYVMTGVAENVLSGQQPEIQMVHRVALLEFKLTNRSGKTLHPDQLTLEVPQGINVGGSYSIDCRTGLEPAAASERISLNLKNCTLEPDGTASVCLVTPPFALKAGQQYSITVSSPEQFWKQSYVVPEDRQFLAGKPNVLPVSIKASDTQGQIIFPDILVKTAAYKSCPYGTSGNQTDINVAFSAQDQLKVFVEDVEKVTDWRNSCYRYITTPDDVTIGHFRPEKTLSLSSKYNAFVMSPYTEGIVDPNGGNESMISLDGQVQDDNDPTGHISAFDIKTAVIAQMEPGVSKFGSEVLMEHKTAVLHLTVPNALKKEMKVRSLTLSVPGETQLGGDYAVDFASKVLVRKETRNNIKLDFVNAALVPGDGTVQAYLVTPDFFLMPGDDLKLVIETVDGMSWENKLILPEALDVKPGEIHHISFERSQFVFKQVWQKTAAELGLCQKISGAAVNGKYVAVQTFGNNDESQFVLCDLKTGEVLKRPASANTFMTRVRTDDAGHFVASRQNIYNAGCQICAYDETTGKWTDKEHAAGLLWWEYSAACPVGLGYGLDVCGDVTKGQAYIHATGPGNHLDGDHTPKIYRWGLSNGLQQNAPSKPDVMDFSNKLGGVDSWTYSNVQRMSDNPAADYYFSFYVDMPDPKTGGSKFYRVDKDLTSFIQMPAENFMYKILDFQVVEIGGKRILFSYEQDHPDASGDVLKIFDITGDKFLKKPGDEGYDKVLLYSVNGIPNREFVNYNVWGNVGTYVEETGSAYVIYIVTSIPGEAATQSNVRLFKMSWFK